MTKTNEVTEKYVDAADCLLAAKNIDAADATVIGQIEKLKKVIEEKSSNIDEKAMATIKEKMQQL